LHRGVPLRLGHRLWRLLYGAAVPIALQGLYVIALRFAAGTGEGNVTSLSYAYLLAATFVSATAFPWEHRYYVLVAVCKPGDKDQLEKDRLFVQRSINYINDD